MKFDIEKYTPPKGKVLVLRTSNADGTSRHDPRFHWNPPGEITEAPDWDPTPECGNGLHGALKGQGWGDLFNWEEGALWHVVEVEESEVVDLDGKVKFPRGIVIFAGDRHTAANLVKRIYPESCVIASTATAGNRGTATAGGEGFIKIEYWNGDDYKWKMGQIGENGLEPNTPYRINDQYEFEEVPNE